MHGVKKTFPAYKYVDFETKSCFAFVTTVSSESIYIIENWFWAQEKTYG